MHDREILETFRDLLKLLETFKSQKIFMNLTKYFMEKMNYFMENEKLAESYL